MKTTVISTSSNKKDEALSYGATDFILSNVPEQIKKVEGKFDLLMLSAHTSSTE